MLPAVKLKMLGEKPQPYEKKENKSQKEICREKLNYNPDIPLF
jgi:hypothetical protein